MKKPGIDPVAGVVAVMTLAALCAMALGRLEAYISPAPHHPIQSIPHAPVA